MDNLEAVIKTAQEARTPAPLLGSDVYHTSTGIIDLEKYEPQPRRKRGIVEVHQAASFVTYLKDHLTSATRVYADTNVKAPAIVGVFNGHPPGAAEDVAGWHDHRVNLVFRKTPEWEKWSGNDKRKMAQGEFAEFVEENLKDIHQPAAADMLEIVQTFIAKQDLSFKQATRLDNGQVNFEYNEMIQGQAGRSGALQIPTQITLGLAPYEGSDPYKITARFRWRIDPETKHLVLWYALDRIQDVVSSVVHDTLKVIGGVGATVLYGKAPTLS